MDLSLPRTALPDLTGKSRKEILALCASRTKIGHVELLEALQRNDIEHTVCSFTKHIFVKNCDWSTLFKISNLVKEVHCDLMVSGGGVGEYFMDIYRCSRTTALFYTRYYHSAIISSLGTYDIVRSVNVGVIDSGCSHSLFDELSKKADVAMHQAMINTVDPHNGDYHDCFSLPDKTVGHGTGVVEIISKCVVPNTQIYVANIGNPFDGSNVVSAMMALFELDVEIVNCSFGVQSTSM